MNPLQKKCVMATAGFHLLLLVILFLGPGFFNRQPPPATFPTLKVIDAGAVEAALTSGSAPTEPAPVTPTPPAPPVNPQPLLAQPTPEPPKPIITPEPAPQPEVHPAKPVEPDVPDKPDDTPDPVPAPKPARHTIDVSLTPVVRNTPKKTVHDTTAEDDAAEAKALRAEARRKAAALARLTSNLTHDLTGGTAVSMPEESSQSTINYGQFVKSIYENAWIAPDSADNDEASPKVHVVIARDGSVISARITEPSGDKAVDASVQRTLDRVTQIKPFSASAKEDERSYDINFNLKTKRMLE